MITIRIITACGACHHVSGDVVQQCHPLHIICDGFFQFIYFVNITAINFVSRIVKYIKVWGRKSDLSGQKSLEVMRLSNIVCENLSETFNVGTVVPFC